MSWSTTGWYALLFAVVFGFVGKILLMVGFGRAWAIPAAVAIGLLCVVLVHHGVIQ